MKVDHRKVSYELSGLQARREHEMNIWTLVAFVVGVLVALYWRRDSRTFRQRAKQEFERLFVTEHGLCKIEQVLHERGRSLQVAYIHANNFRKPSRGDGGDVTEQDVRSEIKRAHGSFDHAIGLAYINGHGQVADRFRKQFQK